MILHTSAKPQHINLLSSPLIWFEERSKIASVDDLLAQLSRAQDERSKARAQFRRPARDVEGMD